MTATGQNLPSVGSGVKPVAGFSDDCVHLIKGALKG